MISKEDKIKLISLIKSNDINNWELCKVLSVSLLGELQGSTWMLSNFYLIKLSDEVVNPEEYSDSLLRFNNYRKIMQYFNYLTEFNKMAPLKSEKDKEYADTIEKEYEKIKNIWKDVN